jgi:hypothetical protein
MAPAITVSQVAESNFAGTAVTEFLFRYVTREQRTNRLTPYRVWPLKQN